MMTKVVFWLPEQSQHSISNASSCKAQLAVTAEIYNSTNDPTVASVPMGTELRLSEQDKSF